MKMTDFFDPLNIDHLRAYKNLQLKGTWPEDFVPWDDVEFEPNWQMMLQSKMADLWVGTNIFMHDMKPSEEPDGTINLDRLFDKAKILKGKKDEG